MKLRCLIVDDEPIAQEIVRKYCSYLPELEVVASCSDALHAKHVLDTAEVDILFLDINMSVLDGFAFLKTLRKQPQVIFTTAYKEYAVDAFSVNACDYLLKPFSLDRFIQAIDKAKANIFSQPPIVASSPAKDLYIKSEGRILKFHTDEILYAEAQGNNVRIVADTGSCTTAITFSAFEAQLPKEDFIRVHRSFIVNKNKIRVIDGNRIFIGSAEIPIGSNYRDQFLRSIGIK